MNLVIAGSRDIRVGIVGIQEYITAARLSPKLVITGGASGIDTDGRNWAVDRGIPHLVCPANWEDLGKRAGPIRNAEMADHADHLLLIWDGKSKGSADMKAKMLRRGKPITEVIV